ncbi:hypothetical protein DFJ77DRAFT_182493 [Powellomyces hirtus]|nr:hypothetical protein DFJ77DRAFT_182493 [Powellomyces hirtus]
MHIAAVIPVVIGTLLCSLIGCDSQPVNRIEKRMVTVWSEVTTTTTATITSTLAVASLPSTVTFFPIVSGVNDRQATVTAPGIPATPTVPAVPVPTATGRIENELPPGGGQASASTPTEPQATAAPPPLPPPPPNPAASPAQAPAPAASAPPAAEQPQQPRPEAPQQQAPAATEPTSPSSSAPAAESSSGMHAGQNKLNVIPGGNAKASATALEENKEGGEGGEEKKEAPSNTLLSVGGTGGFVVVAGMAVGFWYYKSPRSRIARLKV